MNGIPALTAQANSASDAVAMTMLGKGLDATKGQAASLLSSLPSTPKVGIDGHLDGYA